MKPLILKPHSIPDTLPEAKELCQTLMKKMDAQHTRHQQDIEFLKQKYLLALRQVRPGFISQESLKYLFDEAEVTADADYDPEIEGDGTKKEKKKKARKKKKPAIPEHLPVTVVEHDLPEDQKKCAQSGHPLSLMGYDVKKELNYIPAKFEVIEHRYLNYSCNTCKSGVTRLPTPPTLIEKSYVSAELLSIIATRKFCDHLPLYRQENIFNRDGVSIARNVMASWMIKLGEALNPLIGIMKEEILEAEVVSADETPVRILTKDGVRTNTLSYMWQLSRWGPHPLIIFEHDYTRKKEVAESLLGDYAGFIQVDDYAGYDCLFKEDSPRTRVGCLAHCVRKFKDLLKSLPKSGREGHGAVKVVAMIKSLYKVEEDAKEQGLSANDRLKFRLSSEAPAVFEELQKMITSELDLVSKGSPYYRALFYTDHELPKIKHYFENGKIEIDNNFAENAIRPFAVGRRNWLFICSERGAQASANIYSILMTARANGIQPYDYLVKIIKKLPLCKTADDFSTLLPYQQ